MHSDITYLWREYELWWTVLDRASKYLYVSLMEHSCWSGMHVGAG